MTMRTKTNISTKAAVLWASAFVVAAMVITQAGHLPVNPAYADMSQSGGSYTLVTDNSGRGPDADPYELLYVIDSRDQVLLVYEIEDVQQKQITFRGGASLETWFTNARR